MYRRFSFRAKRKVCTTNFFCERNGVLIIYAFAALTLYIVPLINAHWMMLIPISIFIVYDGYFRFYKFKRNNWKDHGRDFKGTLESIRMASQYISFFIALIAISIGLLIEKDLFLCFQHLFDNIFIQFYGLTILVFSGVILLFIPIPYKCGNNDEPTKALKNCFFAVLLMEKIIILLLVYLMILFVKNAVSVESFFSC